MEKIKAMEAAGIRVAKSPADIGATLVAALGATREEAYAWRTGRFSSDRISASGMTRDIDNREDIRTNY